MKNIDINENCRSSRVIVVTAFLVTEFVVSRIRQVLCVVKVCEVK